MMVWQRKGMLFPKTQNEKNDVYEKWCLWENDVYEKMMFMKAFFTNWFWTMTTKPSEWENDHNDCLTKNKNIVFWKHNMTKITWKNLFSLYKGNQDQAVN